MMESTTTQSSVLAESDRDHGNFSILHIILISFGGVVFVIGIIVIIVLLKSRRKLCAGSSSRSGGGGGVAGGVRNTRHTPIFIIGGANRQERGGDNPAFCRSDEVNSGRLPSSVPGAATASRLPTYEEVMSGRAPTAPLSRSQQRSNIRVSQLQRERETTNPNPAEPVPRSHNETPPPRYAYEYPSCFWEEVPPPPYPSGNYGVVRAMGGPRGSTRGEQRTPSGTLPRNCSPHPSRAPLAVPTPTVLSPAQSPALPPRNHTLTSSGRAVPSSAPPPSPLLAVGGREAVGGAEGSRPLASSSPAVPRRHPTPAPMPVPSQLDYIMSAGGVHSGRPHEVVSSSRSEELRGHGHCHGNSAVVHARMAGLANAPIASFDIEL